MTSNIGTTNYMAPEVFERAAVPFKGDIYSLGLILHFMMVKDLPSIKLNVRSDVYSIPSIYSDDIVFLMKMMLKANPEERSQLKDIFALTYVKYYLLKLLSSTLNVNLGVKYDGNA